MHPLAASTLDATCPARPARSRAPALVIEPEGLLCAGDRAGDFVIEEPIGRGSFGSVYRASHAVIGRRAAVKVLREVAAGPRAVASFIEEARLVARLRHPNIVDVLTFGRLDDGRHYQVMDLIDGPTLAELVLERGAIAPAEALSILRGVASALDAVHRAGVVHRDLKPANVVLERREGALHPKLIDFGVARLISPTSDGESEARGGAIGTPRYMSPEQCRGHRVDARADAYAFGLLAYELLTGHPAFSGEDGLELMLKHTSEPAVAPSKRETRLSEAADAILLSLLEKEPDKRPVELVPLVEELERALVPERVRWRWMAVLGLASVALSLSVGWSVSRAAPKPVLRAIPTDTAEAGTSAPDVRSDDRVVVTSTGASVSQPRSAAKQEASSAPPRVDATAGPIVKRSGANAPATPVKPGLEDPENPFRGH